ncbi:MAG: hypothetical protein IH591_12490 [Bacteroidales bacterium]|nr:hypothetical protein [Bacteroidales bacterium]
MDTKISPFDIAEDVLTIELPESEYDNNTQTRYDVVNPVLAITWGQTQTFDINGKPKDSDNDK